VLDYPDWVWQLEHPTFEMLLAEITRRISQAVPQGPLCVAGYSLGAPIAAMAVSSLFDLGRQVHWVAVIDPVLPNATNLGSRPASRLAHDAREAINAGWRSTAEYGWKLVNRAFGRILVPLLPRLGAHGRRLMGMLARPGTLLAQELNIRVMIKSAEFWDRHSVAEPRDVRCLVVHTAELSPDLAFWRSQFTSINMVETDGDHHTLFEGDLAELLLASWTSACQRSSGSAADRDALE
jgi:thioesterase domain-containing protein